MDPHGAVILNEAQGALCPICCDSELDNEELTNPLCQCGYQVCSFCIHRIQTESDNSCPHCRTSYDPERQAELATELAARAELRQKQQKPQRQQPTRRVATPPASPPARARPRGPSANGGAVLEVPRRAGTTAPRPAPPSPARNLHLGQESQWPGLGTTPSPRGRQPPPPPKSQQAKQQPARGAAPAPPPPLPPVAVPSAAPETPPYGVGGWGDSRSASSAPTASGTPPSPATTLQLRYYGNAAVPGSGDPLSTAGECIVVLRGAGGGDFSFGSDPEGAEQVAALRDAVRTGRMTPAAAAAAVVGRLRERRTGLGAFAAPPRAMPPPPGFGSSGGGGAALWDALPPQEPSGAAGGGLFADWGASVAPQLDGLGAPNGLPPSAVFPSSSLGLVMGGGGGGEGPGARGPPPGFGAHVQELYGLAPGAQLR